MFGFRIITVFELTSTIRKQLTIDYFPAGCNFLEFISSLKCFKSVRKKFVSLCLNAFLKFPFLADVSLSIDPELSFRRKKRCALRQTTRTPLKLLSCKKNSQPLINNVVVPQKKCFTSKLAKNHSTLKIHFGMLNYQKHLVVVLCLSGLSINFVSRVGVGLNVDG